MQKLARIDPSKIERSPVTPRERKQHNKQQARQQKEELYQQLSGLCQIGEYEAAKQLARRYESWGYEIIDGEVIEKSENLED
ncbi:hypothetical protein [Oscillatoria sp. FACHB-1406]|uniref:hypothetical protein n=1 Tax=Oscillatoria sp. FACHB-1406 TaxID=2692846 RepID=UPI001689C25C|nr:hypothetical protein [Oscillatoria sp. FACHB-1406]MBD2576527.1 hypothetical protein [Oscillatoria sp. FACHB-1406]